MDAGTKTKKIAQRDILPILPKNIRVCFEGITETLWEQVYEIRLRVGKYPSLSLLNGEWSLNEICKDNSNLSVVIQDDISRTLGLMSQNSIYAIQEEIKAGFLTLRGGHRVGLAGKVICNYRKVQNIKHFSSLNIRIAKEVIGAADTFVDYLVDNGKFINTLLISPPRCGKTTVLRDIIRQISNGIPRLGIKGITVGVVDERSELAACFKGVPQNDMGFRTDVLDNCPKAEGIMMMVRSMGPNIIATDEVGTVEDADAIMTALSAGIGVICTAHGSNMQDVVLRRGLKELIGAQIFGRVIILSNCKGPGTLKAVYDETMSKPLYSIQDSAASTQ